MTKILEDKFKIKT